MNRKHYIRCSSIQHAEVIEKESSFFLVVHKWTVWSNGGYSLTVEFDNQMPDKAGFIEIDHYRYNGTERIPYIRIGSKDTTDTEVFKGLFPQLSKVDYRKNGIVQPRLVTGDQMRNDFLDYATGKAKEVPVSVEAPAWVGLLRKDFVNDASVSG